VTFIALREALDRYLGLRGVSFEHKAKEAKP